MSVSICTDYPPSELDHTVTIEVPALLEAGGVYNINCIVTTDIRPLVKWMGPDGKDISAEDIGSGSGFTPTAGSSITVQSGIADSSITVSSIVVTGKQTILSLSFSPLRTSHGGRYTCMSVVESPPSVKTATKDMIVKSKSSRGNCTVRIMLWCKG